MRTTVKRRPDATGTIACLCAIAILLLTGCGSEPAAVPAIGPDLRQSIRHDLARLGARVTSDDDSGLYASLRNTHVELRESGGVIQSTPRTRKDVQDFGQVNEALARQILDDGEFTAFQQRLRSALTPTTPTTTRNEYSRFRLVVSRAPLRTVISPRFPAKE